MTPSARKALQDRGAWVVVVAILVHVLMMASLFWGYLDPLFYPVDRSRQALDFFAIYEAGHRAIQNVPVYEFHISSSSLAVPYASPYRYVPVFAYAFGVPANTMPPWWAYWGWVAFNELLLVLNAYVTWRVTPDRAWRGITTAMWFVFTPFYVELYQGQFSFLMATALFWTALGLLHGRELQAAVPWAVSLVTKSSTALLAPLFLRIGWWRALTLGSGFVALNLPYFIWRPDELRLFFEDSFGSLFREAPLRYSEFWPGHLGGLSLLKNSLLTLDSSATATPAAYTVILVGCVVGLSLLVTFASQRVDALKLLATWMSAFFLFYSVVWEFHYVMLLPVLVLLVGHRPSARPVALVVFLLLAVPTPYWLLNHVWNTGPVEPPRIVDTLQDVWPMWGVIFYHAAKPVPVAVLWAYLAVSQMREGLTLAWFEAPVTWLQRRAAQRAG